MSETMRMWVEGIFDAAYMVVIWCIIVTMIVRRAAVAPENRGTAKAVLWAFALLALGDTPHMTSRILACLTGTYATTFRILGFEVSTIGLGALSTSITFTLFYVFILIAWRARFGKPYGWFGYLLFVAAAVRLLMLLHPANQWNNALAPRDWSIYRNLPLFLQGIGVGYLIWRDAAKTKDRPFVSIAALIFFTYLCYIPVIFFYHTMPLLGMLMLPKTMAYVAIALVAYSCLYRGQPTPRTKGVAA